MITVLADENIAGLDEYFALHSDVKLVKGAGRTLPSMLDDVRPDALFIRSVTPINASLSFLPKFIGTATLGLDHIDEHFLKKHAIGFASAQGSSKHTVAQYVITAILTLRPHSIHTPIKLGIVGLGNIGATLADYACQLGWQVVGYDPFLPNSNINNSTLDEVLASDCVSIHTPLTFDGEYPTYHLFDQKTLDKLKPDTLLINAARGKIIDEKAMMAFINRGGQVVLDVFEEEPCPKKALLDSLALATPHIAGYSLDGKLKGTDMIYQAFCQHFGLPILVKLENFLPPNPYHFSTLIGRLKENDQTALAEFYDIGADSQTLKSMAAGEQVSAAEFDLLRKNYPLKREWLFV